MGARAELIVLYDPDEREKYEKRNEDSVFHRHEYQYPLNLWHGIYRRGRFPEVAVRTSLKALGNWLPG